MEKSPSWAWCEAGMQKGNGCDLSFPFFAFLMSDGCGLFEEQKWTHKEN